MNDAALAVEILHRLPRLSVVSTPSGPGVVLCQLRNLVTVLVAGVVLVCERYEVEGLERGEVEPYTEAEREWFRRPVKEAA